MGSERDNTKYSHYCTECDNAPCGLVDTAIKAEREQAAKAAESAKLPKGFQWGHNAMEQFNFGKKCAAAAIRNQELHERKLSK